MAPQAHRPGSASLPPTPGGILVAGVGNMFLRDDGFGAEVARRLGAELPGTEWPAGDENVRVVDYGIRGIHLAYDLLDNVDVLILIDAVPNGSVSATDPAGSAPGAIRVQQIRSQDLYPLPEDASTTNMQTTAGPDDAQPAVSAGAAPLDAHGMDPLAVLRQLAGLGGTHPRTFLVGCVPADTREGIGLSTAVASAIPEAVATVRALVMEHRSAGRQGAAGG